MMWLWSGRRQPAGRELRARGRSRRGPALVHARCAVQPASPGCARLTGGRHLTRRLGRVQPAIMARGRGRILPRTATLHHWPSCDQDCSLGHIGSLQASQHALHCIAVRNPSRLLCMPQTRGGRCRVSCGATVFSGTRSEFPVQQWRRPYLWPVQARWLALQGRARRRCCARTPRCCRRMCRCSCWLPCWCARACAL